MTSKARQFIDALTHNSPSYQIEPLPRRGDQVEQWLFTQRQRHSSDGEAWILIDRLLDDYQLHADTATPLDRAVKR